MGPSAVILATALTIAHEGVDCIEAGKFPRLYARFAPSEEVSRGQLFFRAGGRTHWYSVAMKREGEDFVAVLPKPQKTLQRFDYYVAVTDRRFLESRTEEFSPEVVSGPGACAGKKVLAAALPQAGAILISAPPGIAGLPSVPVGFAADGVVAATGGAGTAAAGAGAAAAGGGGLGTTALVVGGVLVAGGAAAAVAVAASGSEELVLSYVIEGPACRSIIVSCVPAPGAVVSSSLDSVTTTADAQGNFVLRPTTPCITSTDPRGSSGGVVFTVTLTIPGCRADITRQWGCAGPGNNPPRTGLNMNCAGAAPTGGVP